MALRPRYFYPLANLGASFSVGLAAPVLKRPFVRDITELQLRSPERAGRIGS